MRKEYMSCKFTPIEVKEADGDSAGTITGLGSHFNNVDHGDDVIRPGAFQKSIDEFNSGETRFKMLWQHDVDRIPGLWTEAKEVENGLQLKGRFVNTPLGQEVRELTRSGAVDGLSIGFMIPPGGAKMNSKGIREISEIKLFEVSVVTFPMNELATVTSAKTALARNGIKGISKRELEAILRDAGLSRMEAKALLAQGFDGLDSGREDLSDLVLAVNKCSEVLKND
jgi:HK97 family phage prohead protease